MRTLSTPVVRGITKFYAGSSETRQIFPPFLLHWPSFGSPGLPRYDRTERQFSFRRIRPGEPLTASCINRRDAAGRSSSVSDRVGPGSRRPCSKERAAAGRRTCGRTEERLGRISQPLSGGASLRRLQPLQEVDGLANFCLTRSCVLAFPLNAEDAPIPYLLQLGEEAGKINAAFA